MMMMMMMNVCLHSCLRNPAWKLQLYWTVWYYLLWPFWLDHIFPQYLINGTIFGNGCWVQNACFLTFFTTFVWNTSHPMNTHRHIVINVHNCTQLYTTVHNCTQLFTYSILFIKLEFSRQMFPESSDIKFRENSFSGSRFVPRGRTDGRQGRWSCSRFSRFCELVRKLPGE